MRYCALIAGAAVFVGGCIDIPKPEVTVEISISDMLKACTDAGYTEEQCQYYICSQYMDGLQPQTEAGK